MSFEKQSFPGNSGGRGASPNDEPLERPPRRSTVYLGIAAALFLLMAIVGLMLYRSIAHPEPGHIAVVRGNPSWLGAELVLTGGTPQRSYSAVIDSSDRHSVPFFVGRGAYTLVVRVGGAEVFRDSLRLDKNRIEYLTLPPEAPTTQRAAAASSSGP